MSDWQAVNGYETTGILTTLQRKELMDQFNAPLISVGMDRVSDAKAGVSMMLPAGVVSFDRYEPPFAHYVPTGEAANNPAPRVVLISQHGDPATLGDVAATMYELLGIDPHTEIHDNLDRPLPIANGETIHEVIVPIVVQNAAFHASRMAIFQPLGVK